MTFKLNADYLKILNEIARAEGRTISYLMRLAVDELLQQRNAETAPAMSLPAFEMTRQDRLALLEQKARDLLVAIQNLRNEESSDR